MKKIYTLFLGILILGSVTAQVSSYSFFANVGTYTPVTQGTVLGSGSIDDNNYVNQPIGFSFVYNGSTYTTFSVNCNGFIALGSTITSSYSPLSTGATNNVIAGLGGDLQGTISTGELRYETIGTAPFRTLVVQWSNFRHYAGTGNLNFQIRLEESTNHIVVQYGSFTENNSFTYQVGMRGSASTDFNNRSTSTDWLTTIPGVVNTATCLLDATVYPPNGLIFSWGTFPVVYNVTGGGVYCTNAGTGLPVGLSGSQSGVTYTLFKDNVAQLPTLQGTGAPLSFGNQLAGVYTITAQNASGTVPMSGIATISSSSQSLVPVFNPIGPLCQGTVPPVLPDHSTNNIYGTWSPSTISTQTPGTYPYLFTPLQGQCADPVSLSITILNSLFSAGPISGPTVVQPGNQGVAYSVAVNPLADSYVWQYTGGSGVTINGTGNAVTLDFAANATSGTLSLTETNSCGNVVSTLNITVHGMPPFTYTIGNDAQVSSNVLEFDLLLLNASLPYTFEMATVQAGIYVNPTIYNGGTLTATIVPGTSQLNPSQQPTSITFTQSANIIKLAAKAPPGAGNGTIISTNPLSPTRICRIRLTDSQPFAACATPTLTFCLTTSPYPTKISNYLGGVNTAYVLNLDNCYSEAYNASMNCSTFWTGNSDNNWLNVSNWDPCVPQAATSVTIPVTSGNYPTLATPASCALLTLESGASFIGSEFLTVGNSVVKRHFPVPGYHYLSSPVLNATFGDIFPANQTGVWAYSYDEPSGDWINRTLTDVLMPGSGYSVTMTTAQDAIFSGQLNSNPLTMTLSNLNSSGDPDREGWNLLGNPFTSALLWDMITPGPGVNGAVYVWNGTSYLTYVGGVGSLPGGVIPAENGFFVKTTIHGSTLTIPLSARAHSAIPFYKKSEQTLLSIKLEGNSFTDETFLHFLPDAASYFDPQLDAYKLKAVEGAPNLYTTVGGVEYSVNSLPLTGNEVIELDFESSREGDFTLDFSGMESFGSTVPVQLQDLKTGDVQDLRQQDIYTFNHVPGNSTHRFNLIFRSLEDLPGLFPVKVYAKFGSIMIENLNEGIRAIHILDISGREIRTLKPGSSVGSTLQLSMVPGVYLVVFDTNKGKESRKVVVP